MKRKEKKRDSLFLQSLIQFKRKERNFNYNLLSPKREWHGAFFKREIIRISVWVVHVIVVSSAGSIAVYSIVFMTLTTKILNKLNKTKLYWQSKKY